MIVLIHNDKIVHEMMEFRTSFEIEPVREKFTNETKWMTIGSCFSEVIGNRLKENKVSVEVNPFGTLFNPMSIFKLLKPNYAPDARLFVVQQERYFHYDFHSQFSANNETQLDEILSVKLEEVQNQLKSVDILIITFGTAFVYQLKTVPTYLANCHKMPASLFEKSLLSVKDICKGFASVYDSLKTVNPNLRILLTVSPVRHTKDGIPENQVSKSILRAACHYLVTDFSDVSYFPSYEIMMDDLRDYRFYKADMIHPNDVAEAYIFEQFSKAYFDDSLVSWINDWQKINRSLTHRPMNGLSKAHQRFLENLLKELKGWRETCNLEKEIRQVEEQLAEIKKQNPD